MFAYLAEHKGTPRGLVHIILHRSGWMDGPPATCRTSSSSPTERGTGMGRALIEHVYDVVKAAGGMRVYWLTHETNTTARNSTTASPTEPGFIEYGKKL